MNGTKKIGHKAEANPRLLILEDSLIDREILEATLGRFYQIQFVDTPLDVEAAALAQRPDLILLDVLLPVGSGYEACALLQAKDSLKGIPIFFVSAKTTSTDRIRGLSLGAEDYIVKPFDPEELRLRIQNRIKGVARFSPMVECCDLRIDVVNQKAFVRPFDSAHAIDLTPIEFKLLAFLVRNEGILFSRKELVSKVWGDNVHITERSVDTYIKSLRQKSKSCAGYFESVYGAGYRFNCRI